MSVDEQRVRRALTLIATAELDLPDAADAAHAQLDAWRQRSAANETAYAQARTQWQMLNAVAPHLQDRLPRPGAGRVRRPARRALLGLAALGATGLSLLSWRHYQTPTFNQQLATGTAQLNHIDLPDGSRIDLSARTVLQVTLYPGRREVLMESGEARFQVARDENRPFIVRARRASVHVLGTVFTVADRAGRTSVAVEHGRLRVEPIEANSPRFELTDRQGVSWRDGERPVAVALSRGANIAAWRDGWLVFDNTPLSVALPEINAFRDRPITLADSALGALTLTGRFRTGNAPQLLDALATMLPLRVSRRDDGSALLQAR